MGNHILQVGKAHGYYQGLKAKKQEEEHDAMRTGLERRERAIYELEKIQGQAEGE